MISTLRVFLGHYATTRIGPPSCTLFTLCRRPSVLRKKIYRINLLEWRKRRIIFLYIYSCLLHHGFSSSNMPAAVYNVQAIYNVVKSALNNFSEVKKIIVSNLNENWNWDRVSEIDLSIIISAYSEYELTK